MAEMSKPDHQPLRLEYIEASTLQDNPSNWRRHGSAQIDALKGVIQEVGWAGALLYNERTARLIDGHARKKIVNPADQVPVLIGSWNEEDERKILLTLDPLAAMAEGDDAAITELLKRVSTDNDAVRALLDTLSKGIERPPLTEQPTQIDKAAELQKKWGTVLGQLWGIGPHRLLCGDATDERNLVRLCTKDDPKMLVTDPPYGVDYDPEWRRGIKGAWSQPKNVGKVFNDDRVDWTPVFLQSRCAVAYVWHSGVKAIETAAALLNAGYDIRNQIVWVKSHFALSRGDYHWQHEPCWYAVKHGERSAWAGDRTQSTFWQIAGLNSAGGDRTGDDTSTGHGTQKPIECMARPIRNHNFGFILDPFCGVGTTLLAAHQLNRIGYGIEIDPGYCAVTLQRLADLGLTPELLR